MYISRSTRTKRKYYDSYSVRAATARGMERNFLNPVLCKTVPSSPVNFDTVFLHEAADAYGCSGCGHREARADTHDVISYSRGSRLSAARDPLPGHRSIFPSRIRNAIVCQSLSLSVLIRVSTDFRKLPRKN